jgi:hypothetical protein
MEEPPGRERERGRGREESGEEPFLKKGFLSRTLSSEKFYPF